MKDIACHKAAVYSSNGEAGSEEGRGGWPTVARALARETDEKQRRDVAVNVDVDTAASAECPRDTDGKRRRKNQRGRRAEDEEAGRSEAEKEGIRDEFITL